MLKSVKTLIAIIGPVYETIDIDNNDALNYVCNIRTLHNNKVPIKVIKELAKLIGTK